MKSELHGQGAKDEVSPGAPPEGSKAPSRPRSHLLALTSVRFFAAAHVVAYHFLKPFVRPGTLLDKFVSTGSLGVVLFFVLSGFILAYTYLESAAQGHLDMRRFWLSRFARVYPAYLLGLILMAPIAFNALRHAHPGAEAFQSFAVHGLARLGLLHAWFPSLTFSVPWNEPSWSISTEAAFYLLFPLIAFPIARMSRTQVLGTLAFAALLILTTQIWYEVANPDRLTAQARLWMTVLVANPLMRFPEFVIGVCLGKLYLLRRLSERPPLMSLPWALLANLALLLACMVWIIPLPDPIRYVAIVLLMGTLIFGLAGVGGVTSRVLSWAPLVLLGEASYALYILQKPISAWLDLLLKRTLNTHLEASLPATLVFFAILIAASILTLRSFEAPMRKWILRRLGSPAPSPG